MTSYEHIDGPRLNTTFEDLADSRTLVKVSLAHGKFESLTVVEHTPMEDFKNIFTIDPPKGLLEAISASGSARLHFEFSSDDGVVHHFVSDIKTISSESICLHFPPFIQRFQQRDNFRIKVNSDAFVRLIIDACEIRMEIDNVSLGGAYCYCLKKHKPRFVEQPLLEGLELTITMPDECHVVPIEQAKVNRLESKPRPKHFGIALEFIRINRNAKKTLTQLIYELQRQQLQHRLKHF